MGQGKLDWVGFDCICEDYTHRNKNDDDVNNSTAPTGCNIKHLTVYKALNPQNIQ